jgi:hypothetical protein
LLGLAALLLALFVWAPPSHAQYGYGGHYYEPPPDDGSSDSGPGGPTIPTPVPTATPTPVPTPVGKGRLTMSLSYSDAEGVGKPFTAEVEPEGVITIDVELGVFGAEPGSFTLSALALDDEVGSVAPTRGSLAGSGTWRVTLRAGSKPGSYPLLFFAQDTRDAYEPVSRMVTVVVISNEPILMASGVPIRAVGDSNALRREHRSWWAMITLRNWVSPSWFEHLCEDLYNDRGLLDAVSEAVRIDRDRLNITHTLPPRESFRSYATLEPIMSKYWAETGITLSAVTANEIGNVFVAWRANTGMVVTMSDDVARVLRTSTPVVKIGNVLNGVGAAMILLDFWSNMSSAESPAEARDAWNKAGYASLDLYLANIVGNTFGAAAALPGMFASYILMSSYDTLIGGHKTCWFNKMVEQAVDADYLAQSIKDTRAVDKVMRAMQSSKGLKGTLTDWWAAEAPTWAGMMAGGCGNWDLAEARGYREAFVDRLMRTADVEINGTRYQPWSFYYAVSRKLALERQRQLAREIATGLRDVEGAYVSSLQQKSFSGSFRVIRADNPTQPIVNAVIRPLEWEHFAGWRTDETGFFVARVDGHQFSPERTILLAVEVEDRSFIFVVRQDAFVEVTP